MFGLYCIHIQQKLSLPLIKVRARASINDLSARVTLSQDYTNSISSEPTECVYVFPIPARAAVCSFEMVKEDGHKVLGIVQEKEEAKATYDKAVEDGKLASLMEQSTPDVFQVKVGNLLPGEKVTINLSYVTELTEDEGNDSIRFHVPSHIGARYGSPPPSSASSRVTATGKEDPFLSLTCAIQSINPIAKIGCPSHSIETELGPDPSLPNASQLPFSNYARVTLNSNAPIEKDFILTITAKGLDNPRCLIERHPSQTDGEGETIAMALTMVPKFTLPDIPSQEFIFVIDRSGSMGPYGNHSQPRIEVAKKALVCALRALPRKGTSFNIVSFGSSHTSLWGKSREYDQNSLEEATRHVDSMSANMGGTELRSAIESVISTRKVDRPTSVFLLTDGDTWDLENTKETVKKGVTSAPDKAYLRLFVLAIGNSASTAMCESIARLGNGASMAVTDGESFTGKTNRLLKAARAPLVSGIKVEWGVGVGEGMGEKAVEKEKGTEVDDGFELLDDDDDESEVTMTDSEPKEKKKINLFDENVDVLEKDSTPVPPPTAVTLPPPPPIQQAPFKIRALSPGNRIYVYAIISSPLWSPNSALPKSVILRGTVDDEHEVELEIPVTESVLSSFDEGLPPPIHTIAARKLIQDLGDGAHPYMDIKEEEKLAATVKAAIVRLGKKYALASEHTSFVAVDESEAKDRKLKKASRENEYDPPVEYSYRRSVGGGGAIPPPPPGAAFRSPMVKCKARMAPMASGPPPPPAAPMPMMLQSAAPANLSNESAPRARMAFSGASLFGSAAPAPAAAPAAAASFGSASSFVPTVDLSAAQSPMMYQAAPPAPPARSAGRGGGLFGGLGRKKSAGAEKEGGAPPKPKTVVGVYETDADRLDALVREQSFEGSFSAVALQVCGTAAPPSSILAILPSGVGALENGELVAITIYVLAYLQKKLQGEKDAWEAVAEKAKEFLQEAVGGKLEISVDDMITKLADTL